MKINTAYLEAHFRVKQHGTWSVVERVTEELANCCPSPLTTRGDSFRIYGLLQIKTQRGVKSGLRTEGRVTQVSPHVCTCVCVLPGMKMTS